MALSDDVAALVKGQQEQALQLARIEQAIEDMNGKSIWKAINALRVLLAVVYALPAIVGGTWLVLKALGKL